VNGPALFLERSQDSLLVLRRDLELLDDDCTDAELPARRVPFRLGEMAVAVAVNAFE
jgi:hypothetical protein